MNRLTLIIIASVSALLIAGATFVAARLLSSREESEVGGDRNLMVVSEGGSGPVSLSLSIKPALELPARPPEVGGVFVRREDNSIFVGTGNIELNVEVDASTGQNSTKTSFNGPVLEVVVTRETVIYRDETKMPSPGAGATSGDQTIQQVVKPVESLAELGENTRNTEVQVWGARSGDRVVAEVFVYRRLDR